ncbi:MAG TPA: GxxExxY protein [Vicinamibacterales bacterium]
MDPALLQQATTTEDTDTNGGHGQLVHAKTTNTILSSAYRVHSRLGPGLLERPYRTCLAYELSNSGVSVETEKVLPVVYDGLTIEFGYRIDLLVDDTVIVEVKAVETLLPVHEAQLLSYLKLSRKRVGLLINFNVAHLRDGIRRKICGF